MVDVPLAALPDRVTTPDGALRCKVIRTDAGGRGTFVRDDGVKVPYSRKLVCRYGAAPAVGTALTVKDVACVVGAVRSEDVRAPQMRYSTVYCTTRWDITGDLPDTVTVYPSTTSTSRDGTTRRVADLTAGIVMAARVDPVSSTESEADGQRRSQSWTLTVDGDLGSQGVDAYSTVLHGSIRYSLVGDPLVHSDAVGGTYSSATLRRVGSGTAVA